MDPHSKENLPDPPKRSSKLRSLIKWTTILGILIAILLISVALLLTYFFPADFVRKELESQGSELLQGRVQIASLSFNILSGLELKNVDYSKQEKRIVQFERLNLDYSLLGLLGGKLNINQIAIEHADVSLNLPEMAAASLAEGETPPTPPSNEPTVIPPIPVSINLASLAIHDSNLDVIVTPTLATALHMLNLNFSGRIEEDEVELNGNVRIANMAIDMNDKHIELPLDMSFSSITDLSDQHVKLKHVTIHSDSHIQLSLSGQLERIFGDPDIDLVLDETRFDMGSILALVDDFVPPDLTNVTLAGILSPTVGIKGSIDEVGFQGTVDGTLTAQDMNVKASQFSSIVEDLDFSMIFSDLNIKDNVPEFGSITLDLSNHHSQYEQYDINDLTVSASTEYFAAGPVKGTIKTTGISSTPALGEVQALSLPFDIQLDAKGNHKTQDVTIHNLGIMIEKIITLKAKGGFHPQITQPQQPNVSLEARITPQIHHILPFVPQKFLESITIQKGSGSDVLTMNLTGFLKKDLTPQWVKASSSIKLTNLSAAIEKVPAQGTLNHMNVLLSTGYNATSGQIGGTVGLAIRASNLQQGDTVSVETTDLKLKSTFLGHTSSSWELTDLRLQDLVKVDLENMSFTDPSLQATLDQLTISAKTKEDIFKQHLVIEHLGVASPNLLDLSMKAAYRMKDEEFTVHADMPFLRVGNLLNRLSGELVQNVAELKPNGTIAMALQSSGHVPKPDEITSFTLPINGNVSLTLRDVDGAFANHQIQGANGTIGVSYTSGDHQQFRVASDLQIHEIQLAPELPISHLSQALTSFNVSVEDLSDIHLHEVRMGLEGADVSVQGNVIGVKDLILGQADLGKTIKNLTANIQTKASVDLSNFQDLLQQFDLIGSGQSQMEVSLSKKTAGPLGIEMAIDTQQINLAQDPIKVTNLNGRLALQKRLKWHDPSSNPLLLESFNPTNVLSRLRSISGKQKSLKADNIDLGLFSLSNFSTHLQFDSKAFKIQNLAMNLLGGGLGGNIVLTTGKAFGTSARIEAAQLDLNQLLTDDLKIAGDSLIDATVGISVFFEKETKALDVRRTEMNLFITHIGQEAVDRLLVFLDPEGSNPTLVSARSQVRLANPSQVTIQMVRGMLDLEIQFSEGLFPPFKLNRFPIGRLRNIQTITQEIPHWDMLATAMELAGAQTYGIDEDGKLVIQ